MKLLLLFKTTAESSLFKTPSSFAVQGKVLSAGLDKLGVEHKVVDRRFADQKLAAYKDFKPDFVIGIGFWGDYEEIVGHPLRYGQKPVPWLVSDGVVLDYQQELSRLPLILATSKYVKATYTRDGVPERKIKVVYEGIDTQVFRPKAKSEPAVAFWRKKFHLQKDELLILTIGGDGMSKGYQEMIHALSLIKGKFDNWRFALKVAASETGKRQTKEDLALARQLGLERKVTFFSEMLAAEEMANLINACDIYASPSHNEGFCRPLVEAQACGIPVLTVNGTTTAEVVKNGYSGFAAKVETTILKQAFQLGDKEIALEEPKVIGVKASSGDLAKYLLMLKETFLRKKLGEQGPKFVKNKFDYVKVAADLVKTIKENY